MGPITKIAKGVRVRTKQQLLKPVSHSGKPTLNRIYNTISIYQKSCWMCINIDIVLHHATIKQYFDSFLTRWETLGCVGQKCVRPPIFFDRYAYGSLPGTLPGFLSFELPAEEATLTPSRGYCQTHR